MKKQCVNCEECIYNKCCQDAYQKRKSCSYKSTTLEYIAESNEISVDECTEEMISQYLKSVQENNYNYALLQLRVFGGLAAIIIGGMLIAYLLFRVTIPRFLIIFTVPLIVQSIDFLRIVIKKR